ncbi:MAG: PD-(D/E)XK nuclease superfamily protein [Candidatus Binataceae bacterium]
MPPRDTRTGAVLERMVLPALEKGGYAYRTQQRIGDRLGGGKQIVDVVAETGSERIIISLKWQQVSGTAEQKVPFELICLEETLLTGSYSRAYIVLGGDGWKLRDFYTSGGLDAYLRLSGKVKILKLEAFVARANIAAL